MRVVRGNRRARFLLLPGAAVCVGSKRRTVWRRALPGVCVEGETERVWEREGGGREGGNEGGSVCVCVCVCEGVSECVCVR